MKTFSFRKEQKRKTANRMGQKEQVLDQVRKVLSSNEQGIILMAR